MAYFCVACQVTQSDPSVDRCSSCSAVRPDVGWTDDVRLGEHVVGGQYRVVRRLGAGGFGVVYEVETVVGALRRALKILSSEWLADPPTRERFVHEALVLEQLNHPNIARCYAAGTLEDEGSLYLLLELVDGPPLTRLIRPHEGEAAMSVRDAVPIARQIASGLVAAHAKGILHRDLKPDNILVVETGGAYHVKVVDFGVAKHMVTGKAVTQNIVGTPIFMAPEQFRPGEILDARLDVWQLGATLFTMLTGRLPFDGTDIAALAAAHERHHLSGPLPSDVDPRLASHPALDRLVGRMLASDRERRPRSAAEVCEALARIEHALDPAVAQTSSLTLLDTLCAHASQRAWIALLRFLLARGDDQAMLVGAAELRLEGWPAELRSAPSSWWEAVKRGDSHPLWPLVRSLDLSRRGLGDDAVAALAENPALTKIVRLDLGGNEIGSDGVAHLADSPHLGALEHLDLSENRVTSAGIEKLARSSALGSLRSLVLRRNGVGARGAAAFAKTTLPLAELDLSDNEIGKDGAAALADGDRLANVRRLVLAGNRIGPDGVAAIATSRNLGGLEHLDLALNSVGPSGAAALALSPSTRRLRSLSLSRNALGQQGLELFVATMRSEALEELDLASNDVGAPGAMVLASSPFARRLRKLEMADNALGDAGLVALLGAAHLSGLEYLGVAQNALGASGVKLLANAPPRLKRLDLSANALGPEGAAALADALPRTRLGELVVQRCDLGGDGLARLLRAAEGRLVDVDAAFNAIGAEGVELVAAVRELASVRSLDLSGNDLGVHGVGRLSASPFWTGLRRLALDANDLGDAGVHALAAMSESMPLLEELSVREDKIRQGGAAALADSTLTARLATLDLSFNDLGDAGCAALVRGRTWHGLQRLIVAGNGIGFGGFSLLSTAPTLPVLCTLDSSQNALAGELDVHSLSRDKVALLEATFARIGDRGADLAEMFYKELFRRAPAVKPLFAKVSMVSQRRHLLSALAMAIDSMRDPDSLAPKLAEMGKRHVGYGVVSTHYHHVTGVLLDVLQAMLGHEWTDDVAEAWCDGLEAIAAVMMRAHREPSPEASSVPTAKTALG
jgi:serine/threonine protein kinase/hemoglobin-like flavoprotein/Ran GTPase-activating protein (RanGAP) involved in mRNA processing and transport